MAALTRVRNNQVYNSDIDASTKLVPGSITGALWNTNLVFGGNLTVGNLTVNGNTTALDTTNLIVADPLLALNRNQSGTPTYDLGFIMGRGNQTNVAFIWEENNKQFQLQYTTESTTAATFGTINNSGYANLQVYGLAAANASVTTFTSTNLVSGNVKFTGGYIDGTSIGSITPNSIVATSVTTSSGGQHIGYHTGAIGANGGNTGAFTTVTAGTIGNVGASITGTTGTFNNINGGLIGNSGALLQGTLVSASASQPNITSVGTLTSLTSTGTISANQVQAGVLGNSGALLTGTLTTAAQPNITSVGTLTSLTSTGTISANQVQAGVLGNNGALLTGTLTTAAQPNITSVGTLTSLTSTGTISAAAINAGTIGNTGATITGGTATFSTVSAGTIGNVGSTHTGTTATFNTVSAGLIGNSGALLQGTLVAASASQPNITSVGTLTSLSTSGTIAAPTINAGVIGNAGAYHYGSNIYLSGNANVNGGLALNTNATITTDQTTAAVFNTTATTLNIGGAATTINLAKNDGTGVVKINGTASSTGSGSGSLQIAGGFYAAGDSYIAGNLTVGNLTSVGYSELIANSPLLYLEAPSIGTYNYEAGFYSHKTDALVGYNHFGFVRNHTDNLWYLFSNIRTEPGSSNTIDLANTYTILDTIKVGNLITANTFDSASTTTGSVTIAGGLGVYRTLYAGSIQNTPIGNGTASTGAFTTLTASSTIYAPTINAQTVNAANLYGATIGNTGANFTGNSLAVVGNISAGNINVTGNYITANIYSQGGIFYGNAAGFGAIYAGISSGYSIVPNTPLQVAANANTYVQINEQNINSGKAATTDYVATANNGTDTTYYIDMGIAGSGYDNTIPYNSLGTSLQPNDAYLYTQGSSGTTVGGNLVIGAVTTAKNINLIAGGVNASDITVTISNTNVYIPRTTTSTSTTTGALQVAGGVGVAGAIYSATLTTTGAITASGTISGPTVNAGTIGNSGATFTGATLTTTGAITASGTIAGPTINGGTIGNSGATFTGASSSLTGASQAASFTTSSGGQLTGYHTGAIGANSANTGNFTTVVTSSNLYAGGNIVAASGTASTTTTTGALVVIGGAGISGAVNVGGNIAAPWFVGSTGVSASRILFNTANPYSGTDININQGQTGNIVLNASGINANVMVQGNTAAGFANLFTINGGTGQVGIKVAPNAMVGNASLIVNSTDSIIIPAGASGQRPSNGTTGMIRYNTGSNQVEYWNAGSSSWSSISGAYTTISEDTFTGDGNQTNFTLSQATTTNSVIVSINGIVQIPITAYSVGGVGNNILTFTEAPLTTDIIDVRTIASTSTVSAIAAGTSQIGLTDTGAGTGNASISVNNTYRYVANSGTSGSNYFGGGIAPIMSPVALVQGSNTAIDTFSATTFSGAKYVVKMKASSGAQQICELIVTANSTVSNYTITANTYIGTGVATVGAFVSAGTVSIVANASGNGSTATFMPIYMP